MSRITRDLEKLFERRSRMWAYCYWIAAGSILAWAAVGFYPRWIVMWLLASSIWFACKAATLWDEVHSIHSTPDDTWKYFLLWPGMNAREFLEEKSATVPRKADWIHAGLKAVFGAALVWWGVRMMPVEDVLLRGWTGLIGLALLLHFGCFHLLALGWQRAGVNAKPIMRAPARATSVAEFWNSRWNIAFSQLARRFVFWPLVRHVNPALASFAVFLVSGVIHDLVISVPAGAGYGLPTGYFMLQGCAVLFERSKIGRWLGLRDGWRGWLFVIVITVGPVFWLFHPPFIRNVMLPMLTAIGATGRKL
jgi:hypothetical protein